MTTNTFARWSKSNPSWGSALRIQRNLYAFRVTMAVTGGAMTCPTCHGPLSLDNAEVDRAIPALDYCESNIIYICGGCNASRGEIQSKGSDWSRVADYVTMVRTASAAVTVPTMAEARAWWQDRPVTPAPVSVFA